jgi:hypothetical protein
MKMTASTDLWKIAVVTDFTGVRAALRTLAPKRVKNRGAAVTAFLVARRTAAPARSTASADTRAPGPPCRCGHDHDAHAHYRGGTECALCPPGHCPRFTGHRRKFGIGESYRPH